MATIENFLLKFKVEGKKSLEDATSLLNELGENTGVAGSAITSLTGRFGPLGLAAGAAGAAFLALGARAVNLAAQISDIAGATGIAEGALLNFRSSVIIAGGSATDFGTIATKLNQSIQEAAAGNQRFQESFKTLGIFVTNAKGEIRSTEEILREVTDRFRSGTLSSAQYAAAVDLLGKNITRLDLTKLEALSDPVKDAEIQQLDAYAESIDKIRDRLERGLVTFFGSVAIEVDNAIKRMEEAERVANKTGNTLGTFSERAALGRFGGVNPLGIGAPPGQRRMTEEEQRIAYEAEMARLMSSYRSRSNDSAPGVPGPQGGFGAIDPNRQKQIDKEIQDSRLRQLQSTENARRVLALSTANDISRIEIQKNFDIEKVKREIAAKEKEFGINLASEQAARIKEIQVQAEVDTNEVRRRLMLERFEEEERQRREIEERIRQIDAERQSAYNTIDVLREQTLILSENSLLSKELVDATDAERRRREQILAIEQQRRSSLEDIKRLTLLPEDERLRREQEINAEYDRRIGLINEESQAIQRREQDFAAGFRDTMRRYEQSLTPLKRGEEFANSVFRNMDSALSNFVNNGKFNFKDFATSVIRDLVLIELRANTVALFRNVLGAAGTALGFRAMGGPVTAGQPYVVGERGAELFVPSTSGTIVPNLGTSNAGALGGSSNVVYNINAVDALSFKQLVARDPSFIFAVTEQGRKSVPSTRR
jgi:hypothetical protein